MLRIRTLSLSAMALALSAAPVLAADLTYEPAPAPISTSSQAFSWTGPYVGATVGYGWSSTDASSQNAFGSINGNGFKGGLYAGYNFDLGNQWVVGAEVDANLDDVSGSSARGDVRQRWDSTARARVGYAFDRYLAYGTGGAAISGASANSYNGAADSNTHLGWTVGAGVEAQVVGNVTARLEYQYADYGKKTYDFGSQGNSDVDFSTNTIRAGVGVKF
ncbi:outer membrane protein [Kaistia sp. 32K]|uniref:outer membrane protein n=1 Tax=Kaistia sp. 32K TaxID=2795690 RepID=UPI001916654E|nr:outer membrane protein [Kaistia sp. 32K]